ncbi:unnamed protein product [Owenia fusiformis]|uniref:Uncharacterized protein n=1 Tax=Owenia fusiformis TaxID=6347 RepID=A0A8J1XGH1_OWEFU|nr:unnamed protein product [Owenia fusiformis]
MATQVQYQPKKSNMTFWAAREPANLMYDSTDHWTKMKLRGKNVDLRPSEQGVNFDTLQSQFQPPSYVSSQTYLGSLRRSQNPGMQDPQSYAERQSGGLTRLPDLDFNTSVINGLNGNVPGAYYLSRPKTKPNKETLRTSFNSRAKEGFNYWEINRPKPTTCAPYRSNYQYWYRTMKGVNVLGRVQTLGHSLPYTKHTRY